MNYGFIRNTILREGKPSSLKIEALPYAAKDLAPEISRDTIDYHYEELAKTYAKRYNAGEGDPEFNEAGVFLHNTLFCHGVLPYATNCRIFCLAKSPITTSSFCAYQTSL